MEHSLPVLIIPLSLNIPCSFSLRAVYIVLHYSWKAVLETGSKLCYRLELVMYVVYYCSSPVIVISVYLDEVEFELEVEVEFSTVVLKVELDRV